MLVRGANPEEIDTYIEAVKDRDEYSFRQLHIRHLLERILWGVAHNSLSPEDQAWVKSILAKIDSEESEYDPYDPYDG